MNSKSYQISSSKTITVYNCTSGPKNPILWNDLQIAVIKFAYKYPTMHPVLYPNFSFRPNYITNWVFSVWYDLIPAGLYDLVLRATGRRPVFYKIAQTYRKLGTLCKIIILT